MTTELEKQFFDTFGIEPRQWYKISMGKKGNFYNEPSHKSYPQITDRILLELICIINKRSDFGLFSSKIDELKDEILDHCLVLVGVDCDFTTGFEEEIKQQVQALFKEG